MRSELDSIRSWYQYNSSVRKKYLNTIFDKVPAEERYRARGASFPSLVDIYVHVLDAYRWWFLFVYQDKISEWHRLREEKKYSMEEVAEEERRIDSHVTNFLNRLTDQDLDRTITVREEGTTWSIELRVMLLHMIEEELQHRGELNALLWQMDIDPPVIGFDDWVREETKLR